MDEYLLDDIKEEMKKNFKGSPKYVFHGTRCPTDIIKEKGIVFDVDFFISKIQQCLEKNNMDLEYWLLYKPGKDLADSLRSEVIWGKLNDSECNNRRKITVSTHVGNAIAGASINPELLYDAVTSIRIYKTPKSQRTRNFRKRAEAYAIEFLERIGEEKVVVIDAKDPAINVTRWHAFTTTESGYVPLGTIIGIVDKPYFSRLVKESRFT